MGYYDGVYSVSVAEDHPTHIVTLNHRYVHKSGKIYNMNYDTDFEEELYYTPY